MKRGEEEAHYYPERARFLHYQIICWWWRRRGGGVEKEIDRERENIKKRENEILTDIES